MSTFQKTGQTVTTATYMHFPSDGNPTTVTLRAQPKATKVRGKSYTVATRLYSQRTATSAKPCSTSECPPEFPNLVEVRISALQSVPLATHVSFLRWVAQQLESESTLKPFMVFNDSVNID